MIGKNPHVFARLGARARMLGKMEAGVEQVSEYLGVAMAI